MATGDLDLSAIFPGMDPEQLRRLMQAYLPSDEDKKAARSDGLMQAGFALLANSRRGQEMQGLGQAGIFGTKAYHDRLDDLTKQHGAALTQAGTAYKLAKDMEGEQRRMALLSSGPPAADAAPAAPSPFPRGGTVEDAMTGAAPGPAAAAPPAPTTAAAGPPNVTTNYYRKKAYAAGFGEAFDMAIASQGDWAGKASTVFSEMSKPHVVAPGNALMSSDGRVLGSAPNIDKGMRVGAGGVVEPLPGYANTSGQIAGAGEQAKADFDIVEIPIDGKLVKLTRTQAANMLGGRSTQAVNLASAAEGAPPTPQERAQLKGFGVSDPAAMAGTTAESTKLGQGLADQRMTIDAQAENAMALKGRIADMRTLVSQFSPSMAAPARQKLGELAYSLGADQKTAEALAGGNVAAMQTFGKQAIQTAFEATKQAMGQGSRIAQQEILMQVQANPNVAMTSAGIESIFKYMDGLSDWQLAKQQAADTYHAEKGTMRGFEAAFNREHPITQYLPSAQELKGSLGVSDTAGQPQLTDAAKNNSTARAVLSQAIKAGDAATIEKLRQKGYVK